MQATASKADLLLSCSWPFDPSLVPARGEGGDSSAAKYGIAFHQEMANCLLGDTSRVPDTAFGRHLEAAQTKLIDWLTRNNWLAECERHVEVSLAYNPSRGEARLCAPPDYENHLYPDLQPGEIGGTADLIVVPADKSRPILVLDHKTGMWGDFSHPERLAQLQVLGHAACKVWGRDSFIPAILHSPKDGLPIVYEGEPVMADITRDDFTDRLRLAMSRVGDGSMRPGAHCQYCPVRTVCPTQHADLLAKAGELVEKADMVGTELILANSNTTLSREEKVGRLHLLMARFRQLDEAAVREMKKALADDPSFEPIRPDGKTLRLNTRKVERFSKKRVLEALGPIEGNELLDKLRECGGLEEKDEVILAAK